jgi:hypothetical protein
MDIRKKIEMTTRAQLMKAYAAAKNWEEYLKGTEYGDKKFPRKLARFHKALHGMTKERFMNRIREEHRDVMHVTATPNRGDKKTLGKFRPTSSTSTGD